MKRFKGAFPAGARGGLGNGAALGEVLLEVEGDIETVFAEHLWPPPLLGLGQPGEHFGEARLVVDKHVRLGLREDKEPWHEPIRRLMADAIGLTVVPSTHEGILWEIKHLIEENYVSRTLFFLPPLAEEQSEEEQRWQETMAKLSAGTDSEGSLASSGFSLTDSHPPWKIVDHQVHSYAQSSSLSDNEFHKTAVGLCGGPMENAGKLQTKRIALILGF